MTDKNTLVIKRVFNAPKEKVYRAWTDPIELAKWMGPENMNTKVETMDFRVGGRYRWTMVGDEKMGTHTVGGEFKEITRDKIVMTWQWEGETMGADGSVLTVEFFDKKNGTEIILTHAELGTPESKDNHEKGWHSTYNALEKYLTQ